MFIKTANNGPEKNKTALRRHLLSLSIALLFVAAMYPGKANAQIVGDLEAKIPFQFQIGDTKLPAGTYRISTVEDSDLEMMQIRSEDGTASAIFQVQQSDSDSTPTKSELIFNKYDGNRYFLSELYDEGNPSGSKVLESKAEKKISQGSVTAQERVAVHRAQRGN